LDKAAELVGTVKQFLKVIESRTAELVNEQKTDLLLNREQLAKLRVLMGQIAASAQATQQELGHFLEEDVRGLILAHLEDAASAAGRAQAEQFGQQVAAEARKALDESSARATAAAKALDQASKHLRQHSVLRAAGITAGGSFGIVAALIVAAWFYLPSKSEMESLRTERAQLQASIEDLSNRGGRLTHTLCGDPKRFCVLIPAHPMTWNTTDNKEAVYVVPVGY
jgi:G3E family GTPase